MKRSVTEGWGVLWRSQNQLDGRVEHLMWDGSFRPAMFRTRVEARAYIESKYGYIRTRPDLRAEPHGWKLPIPVRVRIKLERTA